MTKAASRDEKRKFPRFPVGLTMDIFAKGHTVGKCRGTIADLSVGGMAFKSNAVLEEGMCIYLKVNIPLEIRGEVRHIKGVSSAGMYRYGVRFHKIGYVTPDSARPENFIAAKFQKRSVS
ncbi:MAG: PilZ domain-containing protein [Elusimicrobia bacterium]|nr:PilZ domain-containing protein [Elusimicrobiota bacterium]